MRNKLVGIFQSLHIPNTLHKFGSVTPTGSNRGFTIVELLIVVVIIGILAAIVVVAYNGMTGRAKASKAQSAATSVLKKANIYYALTGSYPGATSTATTGFSVASPSDNSASIQGSNITFAAITAGTPPSTESTIEYAPCAGTGAQISWYDFSKSSAQKITQTIGTCASPTAVWTGGPY